MKGPSVTQLFLQEIINGSDFREGYVYGVCLTLLVLILFFILNWFFFKRKHYVAGIEGETVHGPYFISARAISDLVAAEGARLSGFAIKKTFLIRKKKEYSLRIQLNYTISVNNNSSLPASLEILESNVLRSLEEIFGITSLKKIFVTVASVKKSSSGY